MKLSFLTAAASLLFALSHAAPAQPQPNDGMELNHIPQPQLLAGSGIRLSPAQAVSGGVHAAPDAPLRPEDGVALSHGAPMPNPNEGTEMQEFPHRLRMWTKVQVKNKGFVTLQHQARVKAADIEALRQLPKVRDHFYANPGGRDHLIMREVTGMSTKEAEAWHRSWVTDMKTQFQQVRPEGTLNLVGQTTPPRM